MEQLDDFLEFCRRIRNFPTISNFLDVTSVDSIFPVGTPLALDEDDFELRPDVEDRKEVARRKGHDSPDWSLSVETHRGIAEAVAPEQRSPICFGLDGIDACGSRCHSVSWDL